MSTIHINGQLWLAGLRGQPSRMEPVMAESERRARSGRQVAEHLRSAAWVASYEAVVLNRPRDAIARMERVLEEFPLEPFAPLDRPYLELAVFYARANQPARARELLASYSREVPAQLHQTAKPEFNLATAFTTLAEGNPQQAVREFQAADIGMCKVCALPGLARAWQEAGNEDSAVAVLNRYLSLPDDDRAMVDPLERAGALARLGEIYERRGDTARALSMNGQFLSLWENADPVFRPVVERVKERQRRLTAEK